VPVSSAPMQNLRRRYFQWCGRHVTLTDETRHDVAIKADIIEQVKRKLAQNDASCSGRHARDRVDQLNYITCFQLWCRLCHMVGHSINDATDKELLCIGTTYFVHLHKKPRQHQTSGAVFFHQSRAPKAIGLQPAITASRDSLPDNRSPPILSRVRMRPVITKRRLGRHLVYSVD